MLQGLFLFSIGEVTQRLWVDILCPRNLLALNRDVDVMWKRGEGDPWSLSKEWGGFEFVYFVGL